jgi:cytoskeletal protein CcmA (bactofilin family)
MKKKQNEISIIENGLVFEGTLTAKGRLIIKGTVKGELSGETVVIAPEGSVFASAKVTSITIGGTYEGDLDVQQRLLILSTGNCSGKVTCKDFAVEAGGILNAEVSCLKETGECQGVDPHPAA